MARLRLILFVFLAAGLAVLAMAAPGLAQSKGVLTYDTTLSPSAVSISPGDSVTWSNVSNNVHNLIGSTSDWPAGEMYLVPGDYGTVTFDTVGTYSYYCEYHPTTMRGTVTVGTDPSPTPTISPSPTTSPSPSPTGSPSPTPTDSVSPTPTTSATSVPTPTATQTLGPTPVASPTTLPPYGQDTQPPSGQDGPALAAGSRTPPPDSALKPPLTIFGALGVILLFAANPLIKPHSAAERSAPPPRQPPRRVVH